MNKEHILDIKISNKNEIKDIILSLNLTSQIENMDTVQSIGITVNVINVSLTKYNEVSFELTAQPIKIQVIQDIEPELTLDLLKYNLIDFSDFATILDDKIYTIISHNKSFYLSDYEDSLKFEWAKFNSMILSSPSAEALYYQVKNDSIIVPENDKANALYKILLKNDRVVDISIVEDFITNFFNVRYADLILKYPLQEKYTSLFIKHKDINPIILLEFEDKWLDLSFITSTTTDSELISFFYKKILNNKKYHAEFINKTIKLKQCPAELLKWYPELFDISFIANDLLTHENCPDYILNLFFKVPSYQKIILSNPSIKNNAKFFQTIINNQLNLTESAHEMINKMDLDVNLKLKLISLEKTNNLSTDIEIPYIIGSMNKNYPNEIKYYLDQRNIQIANDLLTKTIDNDITRTLSSADITEIKNHLFTNILSFAASKDSTHHDKTITFINDNEQHGKLLQFTIKEKEYIKETLVNNDSFDQSKLSKIK